MLFEAQQIPTPFLPLYYIQWRNQCAGRGGREEIEDLSLEDPLVSFQFLKILDKMPFFTKK
jgi:hypothetical protein